MNRYLNLSTKRDFFGEDRIKSADFCFITEGLADCIVANQFGFPCLALGSTGISKECQEHLIHLLGEKKCVYLCFDNDENKAGQKGAITIGQILFDACIQIKIIDLPSGSKKMDIAEFMKDREAKDFELLKKEAFSFIKYTLNLCSVSDSLPENYKTAESFVCDRLLNIQNLYRDAYISDEIKQHFNFQNKQRDNLIKQANGWVQNGKENNKVVEDDNGVEEIDHLTLDLITSLEIQKETGLLACEKWVSNNKISIAKVPPELLAKKLVGLREKRYNYSNFIHSIKETFLLQSYEIEEIYQKILGINKGYYNEKKRLNKILIRIQNYSSHIRAKAQDLLKYGDPQNFIYQTFRAIQL